MKENYEDIINTEWNGVSFHGKMSLNERAKIFLPFAALKGFEEAIAEKQRQVELKVNQVHSDSGIQKLSDDDIY